MTFRQPSRQHLKDQYREGRRADRQAYKQIASTAAYTPTQATSDKVMSHSMSYGGVSDTALIKEVQLRRIWWSL